MTHDDDKPLTQQELADAARMVGIVNTGKTLVHLSDGDTLEPGQSKRVALGTTMRSDGDGEVAYFGEDLPPLTWRSIRLEPGERIAERLTQQEMEAVLERARRMLVPSARYFEPAGAGERPRDDLLVSSIKVMHVGGHDHVRIWTRGARAGELVLTEGDGALLAERLGLCEVPPLPPAIHILRHGFAVCGFSDETPNCWPPGHKWVSGEDADKATCAGCGGTPVEANHEHKPVQSIDDAITGRYQHLCKCGVTGTSEIAAATTKMGNSESHLVVDGFGPITWGVEPSSEGAL
jgi:hypothetical protein